MKRIYVLLALTGALGISSCKKTTNNYYPVNMPAFTVNGLSDVYVEHSGGIAQILPIVVQYQDSAQQVVTLSISGVPSGLYIGPTNGDIAKGIPTFSSSLTFSDAAGGVPVGTYHLTLTATGSLSGVKTFNFDLVIY